MKLRLLINSVFSLLIFTCFTLPKLSAQEAAISQLLDQWHLAATNADSMAYFSRMADPSMFIGTDSTEVWDKPTFISYAGPFFAKGKAWDFKLTSRHIYYDKKHKNIAWFDEMLDTWMGPCRGSGVVVKQKGKWLVKHYVLSVTVPNDNIQEVIKAAKSK